MMIKGIKVLLTSVLLLLMQSSVVFSQNTNSRRQQLERDGWTYVTSNMNGYRIKYVKDGSWVTPWEYRATYELYYKGDNNRIYIAVRPYDSDESKYKVFAISPANKTVTQSGGVNSMTFNGVIDDGGEQIYMLYPAY